MAVGRWFVGVVALGVAAVAAAAEPAPGKAPVSESPAAEVPATQAPATQAPATEAPATEAPATEAPATPPAEVPPAPGSGFRTLDVEAKMSGLQAKIDARLAGEPEPEAKAVEAETLARALKAEAAKTPDKEKKGTLEVLATQVANLATGQQLDVEGLVDELVKLITPVVGKKNVKKAREVVEDVLPALEDVIPGIGGETKKKKKKR